MKINPCVIGLGYVGLPLALEISKKYKTIGFDINKKEKSKAFHALEALKERVLLLQGKNKKELEISSSPSGTTIILLIAYNTVA